MKNIITYMALKKCSSKQVAFHPEIKVELLDSNSDPFLMGSKLVSSSEVIPTHERYFGILFRVRKNLRFLFAVVLLIVGLNSCKKFLDHTPDSKLVELKTLPDLQALLDDNLTMNANTPGIGETSSDDGFVSIDTYNSFTVELFKEAYTWQLRKYNYPNDWAYAYNPIFNSNYCLDYLQKIPLTPTNALDWNNVKGSALFYRAYWFLNLLWIFSNSYDSNSAQSDLGIVLRMSADPTLPSTRSSLKESYDQVIKDANTAISYLPNLSIHVMRPSKCAAYGLLARTYLSMREYDSAFKYSNLSLELKNDLLDYNNVLDVNASSLFPFKPFNKEIVFFSSQSGNYPTKNSFRCLTDTTLFALYDPNDIRRKAFFLSYAGFTTFKGNFNSGSFYDLFTGIATSELCLIRAECFARAGKIQEAMNDLNMLLEKRWTTGTFVPINIVDKDEAVKIILQERRKELIKRGIRWADIKRLNKEGWNISLKRILGNNTYTLSPNSSKYALALPQDVVDLTKIPQNPGWEQ